MDKLVKTLMQRWCDEKSASFVTNALVKLQEPLSKCLKKWINDATSRDVVVGDYCYLSHKRTSNDVFWSIAKI